MPQPSGRRPPNSDELAKQIAERLAQTDGPKKTAFSFRNSVLVGRLMSVTIVLLAAGTVVFAVVAGVNWFLDRVGDDTPSVLAAEVSGEETMVDSTIEAEEDSAFQFATTSTTAFVFGPVTTTTLPVFGARITIPAPTTTTTTAPATSAPGSSVTTPATSPPTTRATTTSPPTTLPPTTSSSSPAPTTPTTEPTTTSTEPATTSTTEPTTTSTEPATTSTTEPATTSTEPDPEP